MNFGDSIGIANPPITNHVCLSSSRHTLLPAQTPWPWHWLHLTPSWSRSWCLQQWHRPGLPNSYKLSRSVNTLSLLGSFLISWVRSFDLSSLGAHTEQVTVSLNLSWISHYPEAHKAMSERFCVRKLREGKGFQVSCLCSTMHGVLIPKPSWVCEPW